MKKAFFSMITSKTGLLLALSNIAFLILALATNMPYIEVLFVFWAQTIFIIFFHFIKILRTKNYTIGSQYTHYGIFSKAFNLIFEENDSMFRLLLKKPTKLKLILFYIIAYPSAQLIITIFLIITDLTIFYESTTLLESITSAPILVGLSIFFVNHAISSMLNFDTKKEYDLMELIMQPATRIMPLYAVIIISSFILNIATQFLLIALILTKTIIDYYTHIYEHKR